MRYIRCVIPVMIVFAGVLPAQLNRGSITGTVTDATQAVVPNVKLSVQNVATGITYEGAANDSGQYTVPNLPPGSYTISFEAPSFKVRFQLRAEFLNGFNRGTLGGIQTSVTNPQFGQVTSISGNRSIQLGTRLDF